MGPGLFLGQKGLDLGPGLMAEAAAEGHLGTQLRGALLVGLPLGREPLLGNSLGVTAPLQAPTRPLLHCGLYSLEK